MPLVSIIMPAHNMAPWIATTLRSVLAQTFGDWECLVIDDGSTDATVTCVASAHDCRIHVISQEKAGVSAARNHGLAKARGTYITFLDADDLWHPQALEYFVNAMRAHPTAALAWADYLRFDDTTGRMLPQPSTRLQYTGNGWHDMLIDNFMPIGAVCVLSVLAKQYAFDTSLCISEDRDWFLRILRNREIVHVPKIVMYYRQRGGSAVRDVARFLKDEQTLMQAHLADANIPTHIRARSLSALAFHTAVLRAKDGAIFKALALYCKAICLDPLYLENYLRPVRKILFCMTPEKYLSLKDLHL